MSIRLDHGEDALGEIHEINVTPFIDVILVLLIIFMIAAPLATVDVAVDLPTSNAVRQPRPDKPIFLTVKSDRTLAIGDSPVTPRRAAIGARPAQQQRPRHAHLHARRQDGPLRRAHGRHERAAHGRLSQGRPGRPRIGHGAMTALVADRADPAR